MYVTGPPNSSDCTLKELPFIKKVKIINNNAHSIFQKVVDYFEIFLVGGAVPP